MKGERSQEAAHKRRKKAKSPFRKQRLTSTSPKEKVTRGSNGDPMLAGE